MSNSALPFLLYLYLQNNFMFLRKCVESREVVPIQQECLDSMLSRIAPHLQQGLGQDRLVQELCEEVRENFHKAMVKHTG